MNKELFTKNGTVVGEIKVHKGLYLTIQNPKFNP